MALNSEKPIGSVAIMGVHAILEPFFWSVRQAELFAQRRLCQPGAYIHPMRGNDSGQSAMRNSFVRDFLGDWLIQLDSDHMFEADLIVRLVTTANSNGFDVLTGLYQKRVSPYAPVVYTMVDGRQEYMLFDDFYGQDGGPAKAYRISGAGTGCLFVRRRVFDRIKNELGVEPFTEMEAPGHPGIRYSEDFSFFSRLRSLDEPAWCVPSIQAHHLIHKPVVWKDFDQTLLRA